MGLYIPPWSPGALPQGSSMEGQPSSLCVKGSAARRLQGWVVRPHLPVPPVTVGIS